jgi:hypothetical protein
MGVRLVSGFNLDPKGTIGLPTPQSCGVTSLDELIAWYQPARAITGDIDAKVAS